MKKIIFFSLALLSLTASCKKQSNSQSAPVSDSTVYGKWRWIATYSDEPISTTNPSTPQNSGNEEELIFNTNGTWSEVLNNSTIGSGTFALGHNTKYDSVNFSGTSDEELIHNNYYTFHHDTIDFTNPYSVGGGAKFWIKE